MSFQPFLADFEAALISGFCFRVCLDGEGLVVFALFDVRCCFLDEYFEFGDRFVWCDGCVDESCFPDADCCGIGECVVCFGALVAALDA